MPSLYRRHFFNTLPGPRSVHLIGTLGPRGTANLGVFNSVCHISASPPHLGFIVRSLTVPRHTYHHIKAQGYFTLNVIHNDFLAQAHQTSANYPLADSEFEASGLTIENSTLHPAPYVAESSIKIGLEFAEEHHIRVNGTILVIGKVIEVLLPDEWVAESGHVEHDRSGVLAVSGLDTYHELHGAIRMAYARTGKSQGNS